MPFFSVIVPEHNSSEFMRKGLDSIKNQTFKDYELIIVCDACTDNTVEIAREYSDQVFEINEKTAGAARNLGLDKATGEWVLFMDDDDWFLDKHVFEMLAEKLQKTTCDILAFSFEHRGFGRAKCGMHWVAIWNKAWRRSFIESKPYRFPLWDHGDDALFAKETHKDGKAELWDRSLYYYNYMRPGSLSWREKQGEFKTHEYKNV